MSNYDYIIIGAGASGLLLANTMSTDSFFKDKSILILDKNKKKTNDRTWCFWEKEKGNFESIVHKNWPSIFFAGNTLRQSYHIAPYQYKMIKGIDFYENYLNRLKQFSNITFIQEEVISTVDEEENAIVNTVTIRYSSKQVFNSIFTYEPLKLKQKYPVLQQHFIGWFVKTEYPIFKEKEATFMDFSIPQKGNTRFMYVLPFSATEALVEYTLFSEKTLEKKEYENAIITYLQNAQSGNYEILETEKGNIPMTCYNFQEQNSKHIFQIGIAGGWAKPSTGFTFYNSTKKVKQLVSYLKTGKSLSKFSKKTRFWYYDLLLLDILKKENSLGKSIFEALFKKRKPQLILKFLSEDTSFLEDLKIIWACPKLPFIKALVKRVF